MSDLINYLFPVLIIKQEDQLIIEDRRPTLDMVVSALCAVGLLVFIVSFALGLINAGFFWLILLFGGIAVYLIYRVLSLTFREIYVFDKTADTYYFTRQSALKREVMQGSMSAFRAVQIERREVSDEHTKRIVYSVALLQSQELLFGSSATQVLREHPPLFNTLAHENRIASAIARFLQVNSNGIVNS